jgi:sugar phosphate isomerase/epimerase
MGPPARTPRLGYNTNGFAHHRLDDAVEVIAELGYKSVGLTLDIHHLDPFATDANTIAAFGAKLRDLDLMPVIETGARFLLDPRRKHQPTLLSRDPADRARRVDFLRRAIDLSHALVGPPWSSVISLWSGSPDDDAPPDVLDDRLVEALRPVCDHARARGAVIGFEPEPGMYIEDMAAFARIKAKIDHPAFRLTLDLGHAHLTEASAEDTARAWIADIVNVHVEGMRRPHHDHLVPWEGDLDVPAALRALIAAGYRGPATLELSRHSHDAVRVARRAFDHLALAVEVP